MNIKFFSARDYFNYYFAGVSWLLALWAYALQQGNVEITSSMTRVIDQIPSGMLLFLSLILPFIGGVVLSPVGNLVTILLRRVWGDPADWVLVLPRDSYVRTRRLGRKRISEPARSRLNSKIVRLLGGEPKHPPFYYVRTYVEMNSDEKTRDWVNRALLLANLTESLIIPVPLAWFLVIKTFAGNYVAGTIALLSVAWLCWRYLRLREYWVKHNYRVFLFLPDLSLKEQTDG